MTILAQRNLTETKPAGRYLWQILTGAAHRQKSGARSRSKRISVQPIADARRAPETFIEAQIAAVLKETGGLSLETLVHRVAERLYQTELRRGAAVLDIGIFGTRLFEHDVVDTIRGADGVLWKMV